MRDIKRILSIGFMGAVIFTGSFFNAQAYSPELVHFPMAEEAVDLYNEYYPDNILTAEEKNWIAQGADDEDEKFRFMNHFYDPINNRGMPGYLTSKDWAHNADAQYWSGVYTWEEAISAYERGDKEKAYKALGHVLHLIQDATVPAHTRHDAHPPHYAGHGGTDPYEKASENLSMSGLRYGAPVIYGDINTYFDKVALYTNSHFLSKDSLGFYKNPVPVKIGGDYAYGKDGEGEYKLIKIRRLETKLFTDEIEVYTDSLSDPLVIQDYWERLAPVAVQNTAGILKLFRDTVKEPSEEPQEQKNIFSKLFDGPITTATNTWTGIKSFGGQVGGLFNFAGSSVQVDVEPSPSNSPFQQIQTGTGNLFDVNISSDLESKTKRDIALAEFQQQLQETPLIKKQQPAPIETLKNEEDLEEEPEIIVEESKEQQIKNTERETESEILGESIDNTGGQNAPAFGQGAPYGPLGPGSVTQTSDAPRADTIGHLVIVEIMLASEDSAKDEYILIYNPTPQDISLAGWSIQKLSIAGTTYKKHFEAGHSVLAGGYFKIANLHSSDEIKETADMLHNSFSLTPGNTILLVNSTEEVFSGSEDSVIDKVGFGSAFSPEGDPAPNPKDNEKLVRIKNSGLYVDTNNNAEDFAITVMGEVKKPYVAGDFYVYHEDLNDGENIYPGETIYGPTISFIRLNFYLSGPQWPGTKETNRIRWQISKGEVPGVSTEHIVSSLDGGFKGNNCWDGECEFSALLNGGYFVGLEAGDTLWIGFEDSGKSISVINAWTDYWDSKISEPPGFDHFFEKFFYGGE